MDNSTGCYVSPIKMIISSSRKSSSDYLSYIMTVILLFSSVQLSAQTQRALVIGIGQQEDKARNAGLVENLSHGGTFKGYAAVYSIDRIEGTLTRSSDFYRVIQERQWRIYDRQNIYSSDGTINQEQGA